MIHKLYTHVGNRMSWAQVNVLAALLAVDRALQSSSAAAVSSGIKILIGCKTIADRIHDGCLAHCIDTD